jgi:ComF family protein
MEWAPPLVELMEVSDERWSISPFERWSISPFERWSISPLNGWGLPAPDLIVPVPLHPKRLRERGFNQSGVLAGELARKIKVPVSFDVIRRKHQTLPQTRLKRAERLKNVKGAFEICDVDTVRGRRVLLVDDVYTTGTTLSECARILKSKGGASEVHALTVTRALPD